MQTVYVCSNPQCGAVTATDPHGHCRACVLPTGGGWSFLNLCQTKDGQQWGEHRNCEQLVALAIATKQGSYPLPRDMWSVLPGAMPYVQFDTVA